MSTSPNRPLVHVEIRAGDPTTEIFLIDSNLQLVERGVGVLAVERPAGLYQVKLRAGMNTLEDLIALRSEPFSKSYPPLEFSSPVPLIGTFKTHEFHRGSAEGNSKDEHVNKGSGSHIYVFARDWTSKQWTEEASSGAGSYTNPSRGLTLTDASGVELVNFEEQSEVNLSWEPWAACNVSLDPGSYILRLNAPDGSVWERTLIASPNWQTQCFLLQRNFDGHKGPDLAGATVLLKEAGLGFNSDSGEIRLIELARLGLMNQRSILSAEVEELLTRKFDNPLLGIFGAHLLLELEQKRGRIYQKDLLEHVVGKLRHLLVEPHPDVEALAWKAGLGDRNYQFNIPPMLRRSWALMTCASAEWPDAIPQGSLVNRIYDRILAEEPWLTWAAEQLSSDESPIVDTLALYLQSQLPDEQPQLVSESLASAEVVFSQSESDRQEAIPEPKTGIRDLTEQLSIPRSVVEKYLPQAMEKAKELKRQYKRHGR